MLTKRPLIIDRYVLYDELASGGMASVHLGRLRGSVGFTRTVAIKRMHPHFAKEAEFVAMFIDEARLAARIRHRNVVPTLDVVQTGEEIFLVMEYVQGESLARLMKQARETGPIPSRIAVPIVIDTLYGLDAAHTATSESGSPLDIVHRDVSPQNIMVGVDGVARVFDFGIAKAKHRLHTTRDGAVKGKLAYMAPEQLRGKDLTLQADLYAAAVVLWEALTARRMFEGEHEAQLIHQVLEGVRVPPSEHNPAVSSELDAVIMRALSLDPRQRFDSGRAMAAALEAVCPLAGPSEVGAWVSATAGPALDQRALRIRDIESDADASSPSLAALEELERRGVSDSAPLPSDDLQTSKTKLTSTDRGRPRSALAGPTVALLVTAALLSAGGLAYAWMSVRAKGANGEQPSQVAVDGAPPAKTTAAVGVDPAPSAAAPSATVVLASTRASGNPKPEARPPARLPPRSSATVKTLVAPPASQCSPPYFFDSEGIKHPKKECM